MRLFESVLMRVKKPKKPQQKFLCHVMRLMLMLPGHVTFRNLSRYSPYHEKTFARWFARDVDFVSLNRAAIVEVVPPSHEYVLAFDPSFVPKSGKGTYGLDMFWNGAHNRAEKGLEIATLAWIDVTHNSAYTLSVEQTAPAPQSGAEETRIDAYLAHVARVVTTQPLQALKYLAVDGYFSKKKFVDGICALHLHVIGKLRRDAKQFTGLSDCQARSAGKLRFHFNASLSAVSFAKLEARQSSDRPQASFSMASLKRRSFNQHLVDRILDHLATGGRLEKFSAVYEELCNYGTIDDMAA